MGSKYIIDYAEKLKNGELKEIVGRKKEIRRVMHILLRDMKGNPMLLGQTGLGKTSIVIGVAAALAAGDCPPKLKGRTVVGVDIATMMIDCKTQAEYEDQLKEAFQELQAAKGQKVLFINDLGFLAMTPNGNHEIPKFLKPKVLDGGIQCIVEAELNANKMYNETDPDLMSCLQTILKSRHLPKRRIFCAGSSRVTKKSTALSFPMRFCKKPLPCRRAMSSPACFLKRLWICWTKRRPV